MIACVSNFFRVYYKACPLQHAFFSQQPEQNRDEGQYLLYRDEI